MAGTLDKGAGEWRGDSGGGRGVDCGEGSTGKPGYSRKVRKEKRTEGRRQAWAAWEGSGRRLAVYWKWVYEPRTVALGKRLNLGPGVGQGLLYSLHRRKCDDEKIEN